MTATARDGAGRIGRAVRALPWLLVAVAAVGLCVLLLPGSHGRGEEVLVLLAVGVCVSFALAGLVARRRTPGNPTWRLLVLVGALAGDTFLIASSHPWVGVLGWVGGSLYLAAFGHLLLAYPSGRLGTRPLRAMVALLYLAALANGIGLALFATPEAIDCPRCAASPIAIRDDPQLSDLIGNATGAIALGIAAVGLVVLVVRYRRASPRLRRTLRPVAFTGVAFAALVLLAVAAFALSETFAGVVAAVGTLAFAFLPFGFIGGLAWRRVNRDRLVARLLDDLAAGAPDGIEAAARRALDDPTALLLAGDAGPTDAAGRARTVVGPPAAPLAVLDHDAAVTDDVGLAAAVAAAVEAALERERLADALRERVRELRASRIRLVRAGDAERRALERDLHDGAQQVLVALALTLRLAGERCATDPRAAGALLDAAAADLADARADLAELARGIHPASLADAGLAAALAELAARFPLPVELALDAVPPVLPAPVALAAYYTAAEALTNVAKHAGADHARIAAEVRDGALVLAIEDDGRGGADAAGGSGLRGLADRVGAAGGALHVRSAPGAGTRVEAVLPCA